MSEFSQMIERLRELYLRLEAENSTLLFEPSLSTATPGLSTAETTAAEKQNYYCHGFLDGVKFVQSFYHTYPAPMPSSTKKEGDNP